MYTHCLKQFFTELRYVSRMVCAFVALAALIMVQQARAESLTIAVASNFTQAMEKLKAGFEKTSAHNVRVAYGSSGKLYAQIRHGAPFDLFFSADQQKPQALENDQLALAGSRFTYAIGRLALWSPRSTPTSDLRQRLQSGDYQRLALANPKLAPYGRAAVQVLTTLELNEQDSNRRVWGENISQTYQFVRSGNADMGFVALSQIMTEGHTSSGASWVIPDDFYQPIRQDAVILKVAMNNRAARQFMDYVKSQRGQDIVASFGYLTGKKIKPLTSDRK